MTVSVVGYETKISKFPGGELHFEIVEANKFTWSLPPEFITIECKFDNNDDLFLIAMAADAVRRLYKESKIQLVIPYFPYARQDRHTAPGTSFSLKIATDFINSLKFDHVFIEDPHSVVLPTLLNNVVVYNFNCNHINTFFNDLSASEMEKVVVVSPDAGAVKRSKAIAEDYDLGFAIADKKRDPATGKILSTEIYGTIKDGDIIVIVDDICDGGRTFIELAKVLKSRYANLSINLFVTFGIFSKGMDVFEDFDTVEANYKFWSIK